MRLSLFSSIDASIPTALTVALASESAGLVCDFRVSGKQVYVKEVNRAYAAVQFFTNAGGPLVLGTNGLVFTSSDRVQALTSQFFPSLTAGTLIAQVIPTTLGSTQGVFVMNDGSDNNRVDARPANSNNSACVISSGGATQAALGNSTDTWSAGNTNKVAVSYAANDFALVINGGTPRLDTAGSTPAAFTHLRLGQLNNANPMPGSMAWFIYLPRAMSDAEMQAITTL